MFEVNTNENPIRFNTGLVKFDSFELYKEQAQQVADYINSIELTDDNVAEVKKTLADARKVVNALEDRRKAIKKVVLEDYTEFEQQMKELVSIVDSADASLRSQIRELEEKAREDKKAMLFEIWNARAGLYQIGVVSDELFERYLESRNNKPLNKSESLNKSEKDMTDFLEQTERDLDTISVMDDSKDIRIEYFKCFDLAKSIATVQESKRIATIVFKETQPADEVAMFKVTGKRNIKMVELLLNENQIPFEKR